MVSLPASPATFFVTPPRSFSRNFFVPNALIFSPNAIFGPRESTPYWTATKPLFGTTKRPMFGPILAFLASLGALLALSWPHFDTILAQKGNIFRVKNCIDFLIDFLSHFSFILEAFFHTFSFQNRTRIGKGDFVKMSFSPARGAHFQRFRPHKSIQESMKNRSKNQLLF